MFSQLPQYLSFIWSHLIERDTDSASSNQLPCLVIKTLQACVLSEKKLCVISLACKSVLNTAQLSQFFWNSSLSHLSPALLPLLLFINFLGYRQINMTYYPVIGIFGTFTFLSFIINWIYSNTAEFGLFLRLTITAAKKTFQHRIPITNMFKVIQAFEITFLY